MRIAAVIGMAKPRRWIADCSVEEFAAELTARTGVEAATPDEAIGHFDPSGFESAA
jgi:hypothetical protein